MNNLLQSHNHCVAYCSTVWSSHRGSRSGAQQQCDVSGAAAATEHSTATITVFTTNQRLLHSKHSGITDTATVRCYPTVKSRIICVRRAITTLRYTATCIVTFKVLYDYYMDFHKAQQPIVHVCDVQLCMCVM